MIYIKIVLKQQKREKKYIIYIYNINNKYI